MILLSFAQSPIFVLVCVAWLLGLTLGPPWLSPRTIVSVILFVAAILLILALVLGHPGLHRA